LFPDPVFLSPPRPATLPGHKPYFLETRLVSLCPATPARSDYCFPFSDLSDTPPAPLLTFKLVILVLAERNFPFFICFDTSTPQGPPVFSPPSHFLSEAVAPRLAVLGPGQRTLFFSLNVLVSRLLKSPHFPLFLSLRSPEKRSSNQPSGRQAVFRGLFRLRLFHWPFFFLLDTTEGLFSIPPSCC